MRFAVTGQAGGPDLFPMLEVFGKEKVIKRIEKAAPKLAK